MPRFENFPLTPPLRACRRLDRLGSVVSVRQTASTADSPATDHFFVRIHATDQFLTNHILSIEQVGNYVKCRHLATHAISEFPVSRLKIFHGTLETAKATAVEEVEHSHVKAITAWRGDPLVRTTMEFLSAQSLKMAMSFDYPTAWTLIACVVTATTS